MTTIGHDEALVLLGAYALDALSTDDERAAVERHLDRCAGCRSRLDAYREVAAGLSSEVEPPPELWDRIADQLQPRVVPLAGRRRAKPPRVWIGAAAAAIAFVVGIGAGQLTGNDSDPSVHAIAAEARDDEGASVLTLVDAGGRPAAEAVLTADGRGYLTNRALPELGEDRGYQLWALRDGQPVSVALLGGDPDVEAFRAPSRFEQLLITAEPAIGSPSPTTAPVASVTA